MQISGDIMTLDGLMTGAAMESVDERERHLAIFTVGVNGYVCKNELDADESKALFRGSYRECQAWIERRGIAAALRYVVKHMHDVPELNARGMTPSEILALLFNMDE